MNQRQYPFIKLTTDERFPRLLLTRRPENKTIQQNIYGAFLPKVMVRRMIDLLARILRLRPCELDIQGDFDAPCPQYFLHQCLAPCVAEICDQESYLESVELAHLILSGQSAAALIKIDSKITQLAEQMNFERAAQWHDARLAIEEISTNQKWKIDVSAMTDVITLNVEKNSAQLNLTTLRRGKTVGKLEFRLGYDNFEEILEKFILDYYKFYVPKQIYVPIEFESRKKLEKLLCEKFNRNIKITFLKADKLPPSIIKVQKQVSNLNQNKIQETMQKNSEILNEIKRIFRLKTNSRRIECFDVAHLSGKEIIASRITAVNGKIERSEDFVWEFENLSETAALAAAVETRLRLLSKEESLPDLVLIDGGKPQVNAVRLILKNLDYKNIFVIGAVKPPKAHNRISHFLTMENERVEFEKQSKAMNFLQHLRDSAHTLANETHRNLHSLIQIFKNNETVPPVKYLLVPMRYAERGADAEDLRPIRSISQTGELILKSKNKRMR